MGNDYNGGCVDNGLEGMKLEQKDHKRGFCQSPGKQYDRPALGHLTVAILQCLFLARLMGILSNLLLKEEKEKIQSNII